MQLFQPGGPSQPYRQFQQRIRTETRRGSCLESEYQYHVPYRNSDEYFEKDLSSKRRVYHEEDQFDQHCPNLKPTRSTCSPSGCMMKPDTRRGRAKKRICRHAESHGIEGDQNPAIERVGMSFRKRQRSISTESSMESELSVQHQPFYPHLHNSDNRRNIIKLPSYQSDYNFVGERKSEPYISKTQNDLTNGRIKFAKRKPFTQAQRPTSLSSSSTESFSEDESQTFLHSAKSSNVSPFSSSSTSSSYSDKNDEIFLYPPTWYHLNKNDLKSVDHAFYSDNDVHHFRERLELNKNENFHKQSHRSNQSIFLPPPFPSQIASEQEKVRQKTQIETSFFQSASLESGESEANTSGSVMAEHGHEGENPSGQSHQEIEKEREGGDDDSNRERRSGSGGTGGGGDDRQSSTSTGISKAGEEIEGRRYHLRIVQQPEKGCAFGTNLLARLAIAPPLIVQVRVTDLSNKDVEFDEEIPFLICRVNLLTEKEENADMIVSKQTVQQKGSSSSSSRTRMEIKSSSPSSSSSTLFDSTAQNSFRMLYGTLAATPSRLPDKKQRLRTFFIFPEISIRSKGRFRLNIELFKLNLEGSLIQKSDVQESQIESVNVSREDLHSIGSTIIQTREGSVPLQTESQQETISSRQSVPMMMSSSSQTPSSLLVSIVSEPIDVVPAQEYQAPHITELTRHFAANGVGLLLPPTQASND